MAVELLLGSLKLLTLAIELLIQQTNLRLRLLTCSFCFRRLLGVFGIPSIFLCTQVFEIATECLRIPSDTLEIHFQRCHGPGDVALLGSQTGFLFFRAMQLVRLLCKSFAQIIDLDQMEVQLMSALVMGSLRGSFLGSKLVGALFARDEKMNKLFDV